MFCPFNPNLRDSYTQERDGNPDMEYQACHSRSGKGEARVPRVQDGSMVVEDDPSARCDGMPAVCNPGTWQGKAGIL